MAWNEPDGSGDKDPWGRKRDQRAQRPPDLDRVVKNVQAKLRGVFGGRRPRRRPSGPASQIGVVLIILLAVILWLFSGFYVVQQGQVAVVLRFGQKVAETGPGAHWHFPFPIEHREVVDMDRLRTLDVGFRRNDKTLGVTKVPREALMLTSDSNIADVQFSLQYKIKNANEYLFNLSQPEVVIGQAAESTIRQVVGQSKLDVVLGGGRADIERAVATGTQELLDRYHAGVQIVAANMQPSAPPDEVRPAFEDSEKARDEARRLKAEAQAYANDVVPKARGDAARVLDEAKAYQASTVARADGDARRFDQIVAEYLKAPGVTRERMYIETMERILSSTTKILVDQKHAGQTLYLPLDKLIAAQPSEPAAKPAPPPQLQAPTPSVQEPIRERERGRERERDQRRRGVQP